MAFTTVNQVSGRFTSLLFISSSQTYMYDKLRYMYLCELNISNYYDTHMLLRSNLCQNYIGPYESSAILYLKLDQMHLDLKNSVLLSILSLISYWQICECSQGLITSKKSGACPIRCNADCKI